MAVSAHLNKNALNRARFNYQPRIVAVPDFLRSDDVMKQTIILVVDQLGFLLFLHLFDQETNLFLNLVNGIALQIRDAGLNIQHGGDRVHGIFEGSGVKVNEGFRQVLVVFGAALYISCVLRILDAVEAVDARFHCYPRQKRRQPARGDSRPLGMGLDGMRELTRCLLT